MADERDPQVSRRYRELGGEEPPPSLDRAILAASRRSAAPRRRWAIPLAAAAAAILAVGVALHIERERPDAEALTAPVERPAEVRPQSSEARKSEAEPLLRRQRQDPRLQQAPQDTARDASSAASGRATPETPPPETRSKEERSEAQAAPAAPAAIPRTAPAARAMSDAATPERLLERIAELRKQGRHEEADQALEDFKRRYPDYRIPDK